MSHDIVKLLRDVPRGIGGHYHHLMQKAADEIERLREMLRLEREESAACAIDRKETQRERDEARREVCEMISDADESSKPESAEQVANRRGWDCCKENTNV